jgi:methyl-accepting chemotaxis protein
MKRFRDWPIFRKIMIIPIISLLLTVAGTELVILPRFESWLLEQEKLKVSNVVEIAFQQISDTARYSEEHHIPLAEAQKEVMSKIKQLRYGGNEYFWLNDLTPRMVMHPTNPQLDGTDLTNYKDANGKLLFRAFVNICREKGEGFVSYMWPKPGETKPSPKISYVKLYKPWGWIIGSGLYVDAFKSRLEVLHGTILGAALLLSLVLILLAWSIGRGVKRSIDEGCMFAKEIASGDLTRNLVITRIDEIGVLGSSLNAMANDLRSMIGRITVTAGDLAATSTEIAHASHVMVSSAEQQSADVRETSAASRDIGRQIERVINDVEGLNVSAAESSSSVLELSASIEEVAQNMGNLALSVDEISSSVTQMIESIRQIDVSVHSLKDTSTTTASSVLEFDTSIRQIDAYAKESTTISDRVLSDAETGRKAVDETITGIEVIMAASKTTAAAVASLSEKVQDIGSIITVIESLAQQTNLLSLNASIIAAQAGEHGKGFAVVAGEIKQLAGRTTSSTHEIAEKIKGIQGESDRAVKAIANAEESVHAGEHLSRKAGDALEKIVEGVEQSARQMTEIARATREQALGSKIIREAMEQVSSKSNAIAETTHQQRKGSDLIDAEVRKLREVTSLVMKSMKEQTIAGDQIRDMAQNVSDSSSSIRQACIDQTHGSVRIQKAVESIQQSAAHVMTEIKIVDEGVSKLDANAKSLQQEMASFRH